MNPVWVPLKHHFSKMPLPQANSFSFWIQAGFPIKILCSGHSINCTVLCLWRIQLKYFSIQCSHLWGMQCFIRRFPTFRLLGPIIRAKWRQLTTEHKRNHTDGEKTEILVENLITVLRRSPQKSHGPNRHRTQASAMTARRPTVWAMT
jgi:hypothetical protein